MRAMALTEYGKPLEPREIERPSPPPGYALVEILACGLCFSDVKTIRGNMPYSDTLALPPGHEISGRVVEVNGPSGWAEGTRVVVYQLWGCHSRGACRRAGMMRAVQLNRHRGPEVLEVVDLPSPQPGVGQVCVEVTAAGVKLEVDTYGVEVGGVSDDGPLTHDDQKAVGSRKVDTLAEAPQALSVVELDGFNGDVFDALRGSFAYLTANGVSQ